MTGAFQPSGAYLPIAVILPLAGLVPLFLMPRRSGERAALGLFVLGLVLSTTIAIQVWSSGVAASTAIGGWHPPLGIALRADGTSAALLIMAAAVFLCTGLFAMSERGSALEVPSSYWTLSLCAASAVNLGFLAEDLFTLYVALELLTFAAVPLVCLDGRRPQLEAALLYMLFALVGSVLYLLGAVVIYGATGTLDIALVAQRLDSSFGASAGLAVGLMVAGLAAKSALFPLHLWLPPAHSGAPPAASALLSAVVIKAPIFLLVRIALEIPPAALADKSSLLLGALGAGAILFCGLLAIAQQRLKLLIAYSTAAQIGYVFLMLPLIGGKGSPSLPEAIAWTGGILHLCSHAFSKAAMFMAAGLIVEALGHDRISALGGAARAVPVSIAAFALGGLSLMGLPPSGGFVAKVMLLTSSIQQGMWWIAAVILLGGLLSGGYVLRVLVPTLQRPHEMATFAPVAARRQWVALAIALMAIVLGFVPLQPLAVLFAGRP